MLFRALAAARANLEPDARVSRHIGTINNIYVEEKARSESFRKTLER
jgi:hypothetical protein